MEQKNKPNKNKVEESSAINFSKTKHYVDRSSRGLAILRYLETKIELPNQTFLDNDKELKKTFLSEAENAKHASISMIDVLLNENNLIREYLLRRKAELQDEG
jgi:hypothetical protein